MSKKMRSVGDNVKIKNEPRYRNLEVIDTRTGYKEQEVIVKNVATIAPVANWIPESQLVDFEENG